MTTKNIALLFPGQGSQYVGMGKNLDQSYFDQANTVLDFDLKNLCFEGPLEALSQTTNTQPAILTHSYTLWKKLEALLNEKSITVDFVLGHSVGEYAALVIAGVLNFEDALKAVRYRGKVMQESVDDATGMTAILGSTIEAVEEVCRDLNDVSPANFNCPGQIVMAGSLSGLEKASEKLKELTPRVKARKLAVSAPFHSPFMKPAQEKMQVYLNQVNFSNLKIPYYANSDATLYSTETSPDKVRENLVTQMSAPVLWQQSLEQLPDDCLAIEVGPKKVLAGLVKKTKPEITMISLDTEGGFEQLEEYL